MNREKLIEEISIAGRKLSTATIIFHEAVAEKAGMSGTDHKYLDLVFQEGPMTAGKLAELTGLTTGAITGIIDRLEKQGLVERKRDSDDRRKVMIIPMTENAMLKLGPIFESFRDELNRHYEKYSGEELEIIKKYLVDTIEFLNENAMQLKRDQG